MESRTLVCDRCARGSKFTIAVESAIVQTRTHGTFRIDLCEAHRDSLVHDLDALNTGHIVRSIIEHTLQNRPGVAVSTLELWRITGTGRKLLHLVLQAMADEHKVKLAGKTSGKTVTWVGPAATNGGPPPPLKKERRGVESGRAYEWLRAYMKDHKQAHSREIGNASESAGFSKSALSWARKKLQTEKVLKLKGVKSRSVYHYTGD